VNSVVYIASGGKANAVRVVMLGLVDFRVNSCSARTSGDPFAIVMIYAKPALRAVVVGGQGHTRAVANRTDPAAGAGLRNTIPSG